MKMDIAGRRHHDTGRLERPPFAANQADAGIIDRIAEDRSCELYLAGSEGTGAVHNLAIAWNLAMKQSIVATCAVSAGCAGRAMTACPYRTRTLGQRKI